MVLFLTLARLSFPRSMLNARGDSGPGSLHAGDVERSGEGIVVAGRFRSCGGMVSRRERPFVKQRKAEGCSSPGVLFCESSLRRCQRRALCSLLCLGFPVSLAGSLSESDGSMSTSMMPELAVVERRGVAAAATRDGAWPAPRPRPRPSPRPPTWSPVVGGLSSARRRSSGRAPCRITLSRRWRSR